MSFNREKIVKLFGEPTGYDEAYVFYFLEEGCDNIPPKNCNIFIFYFADEATGLVFEYMTQPYGFSH